MRFRLAEKKDIKSVVDFFDKHLDANNEAVYSEEFLCPFGVGAAIKRNQVVVGVEQDKIVSALRFYPRKSDGVVSVYQFAVDRGHEGAQLVKQMLKFTKHKKFEFSCPINISLNDFYRKIGLKLSRKDEKYNYWVWLAE